MKLYNLIIAAVFALVIVSCGNEYDTSEYFDLEELPGYVAFDADGNNATLAPYTATEDGGSVGVTVENPTGTLSDITVNYSLGGSAVYGTDYTIDGASASGGTLVISSNRGSVAETFRADINVTLLTDDAVDGEKVIEITLTSASNAEGELAVGRGGTDFLKTASVIIADIDM